MTVVADQTAETEPARRVDAISVASVATSREIAPTADQDRETADPSQAPIHAAPLEVAGDIATEEATPLRETVIEETDLLAAELQRALAEEEEAQIGHRGAEATAKAAEADLALIQDLILAQQAPDQSPQFANRAARNLPSERRARRELMVEHLLRRKTTPIKRLMLKRPTTDEAI